MKKLKLVKDLKVCDLVVYEKKIFFVQRVFHCGCSVDVTLYPRVNPAYEAPDFFFTSEGFVTEFDEQIPREWFYFVA